MTTFGDQVFELGGIPVGSGGGLGYPINNHECNMYFVRGGDNNDDGDLEAGSDDQDGKNWVNAFATMQQAFDTVTDHDVIYTFGYIYDASASAQTKDDNEGSDHVSVISAMNRPSIGYENSRIQFGGGSTYGWEIRARGWLIKGHYFKSDETHSKIALKARDTLDETSDGAWIEGNFFDGGSSGVHVDLYGAPRTIKIHGNHFAQCASAITSTNTDEHQTARNFIDGNFFIECLNAITCSMGGSFVTNNFIGLGNNMDKTTGGVKVKLTAPGAVTGWGENLVAGNTFPIAAVDDQTNANGFYDVSSSVWARNYCEAGLITGTSPPTA